MSDTPCVDGCGQDAATIERLRERLAKVEALADEWERDIAIWGANPARTALVTTLHDLRAALEPQNHPRTPRTPRRHPDSPEGTRTRHRAIPAPPERATHTPATRGASTVTTPT